MFWGMALQENCMRILYHHRTLGDGAEGIHIREMVKAFRSLGHEVRVMGPVGESTPDCSVKAGIFARIKRLLPTHLFELCEVAYTAYCFISISVEIWKFRPDFIYDRYITFNAGAVLAGLASRVPVCLEVNAPLALERSQETDEQLVFRKTAFLIERWVSAHASRTIVVSTPLKNYLEAVGVPAGKCLVMPNGVDPDHFYPRAKDGDLSDRLGIANDDFVVGFTGVLRPWHGLDLLVSAFAKLVKRGSKIFLLIVGDGPFLDPLERMIRDLGVERRVGITGRIPHDMVPTHVALFDVAVSPRATFYASPMKVMEYMALGKPVVVPHTANFLDFIDVGVSGLTFEKGNADSLENAIESLCKLPAICSELGLRGREKVENRLNWVWNAKEVCRYFKAR